jgi:hypothetical protein
VIGVDLIDEDGSVLAAVRSQVPLSVAVDIESPYQAPALNRCFQMAVWTVFSRHAKSRGRPTLSESKCAVIFSSRADGFVQPIWSTK